MFTFYVGVQIALKVERLTSLFDSPWAVPRLAQPGRRHAQILGGFFSVQQVGTSHVAPKVDQFPTLGYFTKMKKLLPLLLVACGSSGTDFAGTYTLTQTLTSDTCPFQVGGTATVLTQEVTQKGETCQMTDTSDKTVLEGKCTGSTLHVEQSGVFAAPSCNATLAVTIDLTVNGDSLGGTATANVTGPCFDPCKATFTYAGTKK